MPELISLSSGRRPAALASFAEYGLSLRLKDIEPAAVETLKSALLDAVGCAAGANGSHAVRIAEDAAEKLIGSGPSEATSWLTGDRTSVARAAFLNGVALRFLDYMDVYRGEREVCHPSENIPLAVALCERDGGSGAELLELIAVAYELQLALADTFAFADSNLHHASAGALISAVLIGRAAEADVDQIARAAAIAAARFPVLSVVAKGDVSGIKAFNYPLGVIGGHWASTLAAAGLDGPANAIDWLGARTDWSEPAGWFERVRTPGISLKPYPAQFGLQAVIEACLRLAEPFRPPADIERVVVAVPARIAASTADPAKFAPRNHETADHSLPYCAAVALIDGAFSVASFAARWEDDTVRALIEKIDVRDTFDSSPRGAEVAIRYVDGAETSERIEIPLGDELRPMSRGQVLAKLQLLGPHLPARRIAHLVDRLEEVARVADLVSLWSPVGGAAA